MKNNTQAQRNQFARAQPLHSMLTTAAGQILAVGLSCVFWDGGCVKHPVPLPRCRREDWNGLQTLPNGLPGTGAQKLPWLRTLG